MGKSQYTISQFLERQPSSIICWQTLDRLRAKAVVYSRAVALVLSHPAQGLILRQLRKSQTLSYVTLRGWMVPCKYSQSRSPSARPKMTRWLPLGSLVSSQSNSLMMFFLKSSGLVPPTLLPQTSFPISSMKSSMGWSLVGSLCSAFIFPQLFPESPPFTPKFWKSLLLHMFHFLRYLQMEWVAQGVVLCPVYADSCGMSNSSASFGSRSLKVPFSIMLTLKNFQGIEKWAPAESPTTPTPNRVDFPHSFSYKSAPFASMPNIPLQSWSRDDLPAFLPGYTFESNSLQSAPRQWQPLKVLMSEKESLSRSKGGLCLSPKRLTNKSMSHCQGLGLDSSLKSSSQLMRGVTSSTNCLSSASALPKILHLGFLQRLEE